MATDTFKFDSKLLREHLDKVVEYHNQFVGKKGHNPFFYLRDKVNPLIRRLTGYNDVDAKGKEVKVPPETTKELSDAIMALPLKDNAPLVVTSPEDKKEP